MPIKSATTACPLDCYGVCSFKVESDGERVISLEPNTDNPVTGHLICSKGRSHLSRMVHPDRLLTPMKRTGDHWEAITWDAAMLLMTERISAALEAYGPLSIASYMGGGAAGKLKGVMELFFRHLGGGTVFSGGLCWSAGIAAQTLDFGQVISHEPEDLLNAGHIVLWGKNPADTHFHLMPWMTKARHNGCRILLVDPIAGATANHSDHVIRPMPGTDWALAITVLQGCLKTLPLTDERRGELEHHAPGLIDSILNADSDRLLAVCGLRHEDAAPLIEAYSTGPCATLVGYGLQRSSHGGAAVRLIDLLGYVTGQIGRAGGGVSYANKINGSLFDWSWAEPKAAVAERALRQGAFGQDLLSAAEPPVKLLFIACGNPALQAPDSGAIADALAAMDLVVVIDHFMTDTARLADLVLPAAYFLEEENVITSGMWNSLIHYAPKLVEPRGEARSELLIFSELARRLNLQEFPQLSESQWLERLMAPAAAKGIPLQQLRDAGWLRSPNHAAIPWADNRFSTDDGRFHPIHAEAVAQLVAEASVNESVATLPLISYHRRDSINSQHTRELPPGPPVAQVHPDTLMEFGFASGDTAHLVNTGGKLTVNLKADDAVRPGIIALQQGLWKHQGQCLNALSPSGTSDIGGQALLNAGRVRIARPGLENR